MRRRAPDLAPDSKRQKTEAADGVARFAYAAADVFASGSRGFLVTCGFRRYAGRVLQTPLHVVQQQASTAATAHAATAAQAYVMFPHSLLRTHVEHSINIAMPLLCVQGKDQHQGGYGAPAAAAATGHRHSAGQGEGLLCCLTSVSAQH
jgi:hypothetical protein